MPFKASPGKGTKAAGLFNSVKKESAYVTGPLDRYLTELPPDGGDRAINVNAPSAIGSCPRSIWYARTGAKQDSGFIEPRTRRIFDNGHHVHARLQKYLLDAGLLLLDEAPVRSDRHCIQGHTDGILSIDGATGELGVLEIKSINDGNFRDLRDAKREHKRQALIYLHCLEERRRELRRGHRTFQGFAGSIHERIAYYGSLYAHIADGGGRSGEAKLARKLERHSVLDSLLYKCRIPMTKAVLVYENKNDQSMKEFVVDAGTKEGAGIVAELLAQCALVNEAVEKGLAPAREGAGKSDPVCRWCNYRAACWG